MNLSGSSACWSCSNASSSFSFFWNLWNQCLEIISEVQTALILIGSSTKGNIEQVISFCMTSYLSINKYSGMKTEAEKISESWRWDQLCPVCSSASDSGGGGSWPLLAKSGATLKPPERRDSGSDQAKTPPPGSPCTPGADKVWPPAPARLLLSAALSWRWLTD